MFFTSLRRFSMSFSVAGALTAFQIGCSPESEPAASSHSTPAATASTDSDVVAPPLPYFNPVTPEQAHEGWISLFDGHSLFGWRLNPEAANWTVADGVITAEAGPIDLLCTSVPFADYELKIDFRMDPGGNSGVFLRTPMKPAGPTKDCYELNIADQHPQGFTTGAFVGHKATDSPIVGSGGWKTFHVVAEGPKFTVDLDGERVLDYIDDAVDRPPSGLIGLQKNEGKVEFRNILLKPLGAQPLFNGQDLSGWKVVPGLKSRIAVEDGTIHLTNGLGFLENEGTWEDFLFQAESRVNAPPTNSGYFFRALPIADGGNCDGYEVQIDNNTTDGDRSRPSNAGTGAIFRRAEARYVVPDNGEWFTTTLAAHGPRLSVWVDGYQVVDFEDTRPADENPRRGTRLAPGHIALQGHDEQTDVSFRNLRVAPLPPRH